MRNITELGHLTSCHLSFSFCDNFISVDGGTFGEDLIQSDHPDLHDERIIEALKLVYGKVLFFKK